MRPPPMLAMESRQRAGEIWAGRFDRSELLFCHFFFYFFWQKAEQTLNLF
jgi:hypothetical protein